MVTLKRGPGCVDNESTKTDEDQKRFDPPGIASLGRPKATAGGQRSRLPHSATPSIIFRNRSWGQTITADFELGKRANLSVLSQFEIEGRGNGSDQFLINQFLIRIREDSPASDFCSDRN